MSTPQRETGHVASMNKKKKGNILRFKVFNISIQNLMSNGLTYHRRYTFDHE